MKPVLRATAASLLVALWILWPRAAQSHGAATTTVLFDREIVRILNNRCVMCHEEGGLSFPLATYEQTWLRGRAIRAEVLRRHMPPWPAVAGYGRFANDNSLTLRETQFMVSWVEGLGPRNAGTVFLNVNDPRTQARQEVRASSHAGHWQLGEPDLVRPLAANRIGAGQADFVARTVVDLGLTAPRSFRALEYMPGDRRVVRAAVFTLEQTGQWLGSWTPWYGFTKLPDGAAHVLPAGSRVVADMYYRGASEPVADRGTLGLFYADRPVATRTSDLVLEARPGGTPGTRRATRRITSDTFVWAIRPDVVPGVQSIEVSARTPEGATDVMLFARDPSTEWPTPFILEKPVHLRRGTILSFVTRSGDEAAASRPGSLRLTLSRY